MKVNDKNALNETAFIGNCFFKGITLIIEFTLREFIYDNGS